MNEAPRHLAADPVRRVALNLDHPTFHVGAEVHAGVTENLHVAPRHAAADPFDTCHVAAEFHFVATIALDVEKRVESELALAKQDGEGANIRISQADDAIGGDDLR